jgi:signal transduction histidine kinase
MLDGTLPLRERAPAAGRSVSAAGFAPPRALTASSRSEDVIAISRVVLAVVSLITLRLDPSEPARHAGAVDMLMAWYTGYAILLVGLLHGLPAISRRFSVLTQAIDLAMFTLLNYLTEPATSPFFVYFLYALLCAAVRWRWHGVLLTSGAALSAVLAVTLWGSYVVDGEKFDLNRFVIRGAYLAVMAILLAYLVNCKDRLGDEMAKLAGWPRNTHDDDVHALVSRVLARTAAVLQADRVLLVWEESEEPWRHLVLWQGDLQWWREPPSGDGFLVAEALSRVDFLCDDATRPKMVLCAAADGFTVWHGVPIDAEARARFRIRSVISVIVDGESAAGRLFVLDKSRLDSDDLHLAQIVGRHVAASIDQFHLIQQLKSSAGMRERMALARDLHDGVLQALAGIALKLDALRRLVFGDAARRHLEEMRAVVSAEQRDLRSLIGMLRLNSTTVRVPHLVESLGELARRVERQFRVRISVAVDTVERLPEPTAREVYLLAREAIMNAAKHADALKIDVAVRTEPVGVVIRVADDGRGFPYRGHYDHEAINDLKLGPVSLRERVASLNGRLTLDSGEDGSRIEIAVPVAGEEH